MNARASVRGTTLIVQRWLPDDVSETVLIDSGDCSTIATLPGMLHGQFGDVVWWTEAHAPSRLGATDLRTLETRWFALGDLANGRTSWLQASPDGAKAILMGTAGTPPVNAVHLVDLATGEDTPLDVAQVLPRATSSLVLFDASRAAYTFGGLTIQRIDLTTGAIVSAPMPGGEVTSDCKVIAVPGTPWLFVDRSDRAFVLDGETMAVVRELLPPVAASPADVTSP